MSRKIVSDQMGNQLIMELPVKRIVSLVPSQTELLFDLGLNAEVIGITKFCVHPPHWRESKRIVGGTKNFHFNIMDQLNPDIILGNKEENYQAGIDELKKKYAVWMSDIVTLGDALSMITSIGELTGRESAGLSMVTQIRTLFEQIKPINARALYLIWRKPWMGVGQSTFINSMLQTLGLENILDSFRYPELSDEQLGDLQPEVVFLSSEPYPFHKDHIEEVHRLLPKSKIILVDGEMFSWYGSRLLRAPNYFNNLKF